MSKVIFDKMTEVDEFDNLEDLEMFIEDEEFDEEDFSEEKMAANLDEDFIGKSDDEYEYEYEDKDEAFSDDSMRTFLEDDDLDINPLREEVRQDFGKDGACRRPASRPIDCTNSVALRKAYCVGKRDGIREGRVLGYREGFQDGLEKGKRIGFKAGYAAGFRDGKCRGFEEGRLAGYAKGLVDGRAQGFEVGKRVGFEKGFRAGFCAGLRAARSRRRSRRCGFCPPNPFGC